MAHVLKLRGVAPDMDQKENRMTDDLHKEGIEACFTPSSNRLFSEYMIGPIIGRGGFSVVRAARCKKSGQEMAVKILNKSHHVGSVKRVRRLKDEMRVLASLRHPNIISLISIFENEHELMLVMERAHGGELFDRIVNRGHFTERDAAMVARGMFAALEHLHLHGVMHRDVKPENLLLQHPLGWEVKLSDFGLVGLLEDTWKQSTETPAEVTPTSTESDDHVGPKSSEVVNLQTLCGSSYYIAPEIVLRERYKVEVDIWSAGVVMYIMLCGSPPFENSPALIPDWQITFPDAWGWDVVSDSAKDLISRMLVQQPANRISAAECVRHEWLSADLSSVDCLSPKFPRMFKSFNDKRKRSTSHAESAQSPSNNDSERSFEVASPPRQKKQNLAESIGSLSLQPPLPPSTLPPMLSNDDSQGDSFTASPDTSCFRSAKEMETMLEQHDAWVQSDLPFRFSPKSSPTYQVPGFGESRPTASVPLAMEEPIIPAAVNLKIYSESSHISTSDNETFVTGNSSTLEYDTMSSDESSGED